MNKLFLLFCFCMLLASCGIGLYSPINEVPVSVNKKGDINVAMAVNHGTALKMQLATVYSPIKHIGLAYSGIFNGGQKSHGFAIGYYFNLDKSANIKNTYAIYSGLSIGESSHSRILRTFSANPSNSPNTITGEYRKYFTNITATYMRPKFNLELSARLVTLYYSKLTIVALRPEIFDEVNKIIKNNPAVFFELGYKYEYNLYKLKAFIGLNQRLSLINDLPKFETTTLSTGLYFNLNQCFNSKTK